jgi:hypothetical protein
MAQVSARIKDRLAIQSYAFLTSSLGRRYFGIHRHVFGGSVLLAIFGTVYGVLPGTKKKAH